MRVIYYGTPPLFKKITEPNNLGLDRPFILTDQFDNRIIDFYFELKKKGMEHKLVIFGNLPFVNKECSKELVKRGIQDDVLFMGYLSPDKLVHLYNRASLFFYIHLFEGFGLPPLEAIACGCPVIASNRESIPEVVGEAGVIIDPFDLGKQVNEAYKILTNPQLANGLAEKGLRRAKEFSWERNAGETIKAYREVLKES